MEITHLYTAKGGQGCTVTAALLALQKPGRTLIVDAALVADMPAVLGIYPPIDWDVTCGVAAAVTPTISLVRDHVDLNLYGWDYDHVIYDHGLDEPPDYHGDDKWILVTRGCYVALKHALSHDRRPDGVILLIEEGRALRADDVTATLGAPIIASALIDRSVARKVDAGLLVYRNTRTDLLIHQEVNI